jgi:argininosuccinate synthase
MARPARATTRSASSCRLLRAEARTSRSSRRGANGTFKSATDLLDFAEQHQIPIAKDKRGEAPFSVDANLLHSSSEGKVLEDPASSRRICLPAHHLAEDAPDKATDHHHRLRAGDPVAIDGKKLSPATLLTKLNDSAATTASAASTWSRTASSA